jgi:hypothetical protein
MNREKLTTPTLRPTLEEICNRFETWRKNKLRPRDKIPNALWGAAVELCKDHSILRVSRALRLNYNDLKHRVQGVEKIDVSSSGACSDFVELDFGGSILPSECVVEMEAPNGAKMKMYFKGQQRDFDAVALSRAFWRQGL